MVTDPFSDSVGFAMPNVNASMVTVSNAHPHHSNADAVQGKPFVVSGPGEYEVGGVFVLGLSTAPANEADGPNTVYLMEMDGVAICHLGDLSRPLLSSQVEQLRDVQVLMIPAGGRCTLPALADRRRDKPPEPPPRRADALRRARPGRGVGPAGAVHPGVGD